MKFIYEPITKKVSFVEEESPKPELTVETGYSGFKFGEGLKGVKKEAKEAVISFITKTMENFLKNEEIEPVEKDKEKRKFYAKLYCNYYIEQNGEYTNWDIEVEKFVLNGKVYPPEAFEVIVESSSPSMFYDLTSKHQEITEENIFKFLEYEIEQVLKNNVKQKVQPTSWPTVKKSLNCQEKSKRWKIEEVKKGTVKWFSKEKGYGFITGEDNQDYFFHIKEVKGTELPNNKDKVEFKTEETKKGLKAVNVKITEKSSATEKNSLATCPHCKKKMVPRVVFKYGSPVESICPFCGKQYKDFTANIDPITWIFLGIIGFIILMYFIMS